MRIATWKLSHKKLQFRFGKPNALKCHRKHMNGASEAAGVSALLRLSYTHADTHRHSHRRADTHTQTHIHTQTNTNIRTYKRRRAHTQIRTHQLRDRRTGTAASPEPTALSYTHLYCTTHTHILTPATHILSWGTTCVYSRPCRRRPW